jgi:hypothetical protein
MADFACQVDWPWRAQIKLYLWVPSASEWVGWDPQLAPPNSPSPVAVTPARPGLNTDKGRERRIHPLAASLRWDVSFYPALGPDLDTNGSNGSQAESHYWLGLQLTGSRW